MAVLGETYALGIMKWRILALERENDKGQLSLSHIHHLRKSLNQARGSEGRAKHKPTTYTRNSTLSSLAGKRPEECESGLVSM